MRIYPVLLLLATLLPLPALGSDAGDFVGADTSGQARLLETWAAQPVPGRLPLLQALQDGRLAADSDKHPFIDNQGTLEGIDTPTPTTVCVGC